MQIIYKLVDCGGEELKVSEVLDHDDPSEHYACVNIGNGDPFWFSESMLKDFVSAVENVLEKAKNEL